MQTQDKTARDHETSRRINTGLRSVSCTSGQESGGVFFINTGWFLGKIEGFAAAGSVQ